VGAKDAPAIVPALEERLVADEDGVADLEGLWMKHEHAETDANAVPE
jgi:hypothetical protein